MILPEAKSPDPKLGGIIKLAALAVGGQGGGVLTGWIEDLARSNGYVAQATSVAGVAQRTGATVYYVEMAPASPTGTPIFSLMPAAGDVDIMIAAEMMEAGRSIIRGFVTPDRTTLIASTHRALAVSEKMVPGDGIADSREVMAAAEIAARRFIHADFDALAIRNGSVISATLFGALAASEALPFPASAFEDAIRKGGKGVEGSLRAFRAGYETVVSGKQESPAKETTTSPGITGPSRLLAQWQRLEMRIANLPETARDMAKIGLQKVVDFQDTAYGDAYLDRLETLAKRDHEPYDLTREGAKYIANAMAYDDIIRVARAKTKHGRQGRIAGEMGAREQNVMQVTEFLHPRAEEIISMLPARMGARWAANPRRMALVDRLFNKGRRIRTDKIGGFLTLYILGGLKFWRLRTLRHAEEIAHLDRWLANAVSHVDQNYELAVEVIRCRRLVKGYSDTHARGLSKFDQVIEAIGLVKHRDDAADWARRLKDAALKDEQGKALTGAIDTIKSFA